LAEGGHIFSDDGTKSLMDSPEAIAGIQYWLDLVYKHKVAPTPKDLSSRKLGSNAFGMTGKVGMVYNGIYFWNGYKKNQSLDFEHHLHSARAEVQRHEPADGRIGHVEGEPGARTWHGSSRSSSSRSRRKSSTSPAASTGCR